jgi:hypothetical protein
VKKKFNTMPPRRGTEPPVENQVVEREIRELHSKLDAMETKQRRAPDVGAISDVEKKEV